MKMVESVDDLKSSRFIRGTHGPDFEVLEAKIASALNRIIQNTRFKKKVSLEEMKAQKEDLFLRGRQIAYLSYEYFRVTGANDSVENYADLFAVVLRNDDIQEFDSKWDEILLSMTQIPSDDILESLHELRIRESENLKTVLELYNMEIHQKTAGHDYHRLKTMVKRSIEQNLRMKNFEARNGHFESSAVVNNQKKKNGDKIAMAILKNTRQLGCVFQDMEPPKYSSILRKSSDIRKPIRCVQFTKAVVRHANIRDIGLKKRRKGKSDMPVKRRGKWQDVS